MFRSITIDKGLLAAAAFVASFALAGPAHASSTNGASGASSAALVVPAQSTFVDINLAGWTSFSDFASPLNSSVLLDVGAGRGVLGFDYFGVSITTANGSYLQELVLSVNRTDNPVTGFLDWAPSTVADPGTASGLAGTWNGAQGGPGAYGTGAPFAALANGLVYVTVYELIDDPLLDGGAPNKLDATITAGTLRLYLSATAIPEPGAGVMLAFGLVALSWFVRRRSGSCAP